MFTIHQIDREELKRKLDRGERMKLVMAMPEWAYHNAHIPGSLHLTSIQEAALLLGPDDEIIVYCTGSPCPASLWAYQMLKQAGYQHVRYYAGGLADWDVAGYPLEGEMIDRRTRARSKRRVTGYSQATRH